jgi:hypothetical protein
VVGLAGSCLLMVPIIQFYPTGGVKLNALEIFK